MEWKSAFEVEHHKDVVTKIVEQSGYQAMLRSEKTPENEGRLENIKELLKALDGFENIEVFLEHVSLVSDHESGSDRDQVSIMTLHAAKGLEFNTVFLPGWEDGIFPHQRALDENGSKGLEEERRLAYVGITRAQRKLYITFAMNRRVFGQWQNSSTSRFIEELADEDIEKIKVGGVNSNFRGAQPIKSAAINLRGSSEHANSKFRLGEKVSHKKFGSGYISNISGNQLEVLFDRAGLKRIIDSFVEKQF